MVARNLPLFNRSQHQQQPQDDPVTPDDCDNTIKASNHFGRSIGNVAVIEDEEKLKSRPEKASSAYSDEGTADDTPPSLEYDDVDDDDEDEDEHEEADDEVRDIPPATPPRVSRRFKHSSSNISNDSGSSTTALAGSTAAVTAAAVAAGPFLHYKSPRMKRSANPHHHHHGRKTAATHTIHGRTVSLKSNIVERTTKAPLTTTPAPLPPYARVEDYDPNMISIPVNKFNTSVATYRRYQILEDGLAQTQRLEEDCYKLEMALDHLRGEVSDKLEPRYRQLCTDVVRLWIPSAPALTTPDTTDVIQATPEQQRLLNSNEVVLRMILDDIREYCNKIRDVNHRIEQWNQRKEVAELRLREAKREVAVRTHWTKTLPQSASMHISQPIPLTRRQISNLSSTLSSTLGTDDGNDADGASDLSASEDGSSSIYSYEDGSSVGSYLTTSTRRRRRTVKWSDQLDTSTAMALPDKTGYFLTAASMSEMVPSPDTKQDSDQIFDTKALQAPPPPEDEEERWFGTFDSRVICEPLVESVIMTEEGDVDYDGVCIILPKALWDKLMQKRPPATLTSLDLAHWMERKQHLQEEWKQVQSRQRDLEDWIQALVELRVVALRQEGKWRAGNSTANLESVNLNKNEARSMSIGGGSGSNRKNQLVRWVRGTVRHGQLVASVRLALFQWKQSNGRLTLLKQEEAQRIREARALHNEIQVTGRKVVQVREEHMVQKMRHARAAQANPLLVTEVTASYKRPKVKRKKKKKKKSSKSTSSSATSSIPSSTASSRTSSHSRSSASSMSPTRVPRKYRKHNML